MNTSKKLNLSKETLRVLSDHSKSAVNGMGPTTLTAKPVCRQDSALVACSQDACFSAVYIDGGCLNQTEVCLK